MGIPNPKTSPRRINALERRIEALNYRKQGLTFLEIAERMGVSRTRARQLVADGFQRLRGEMLASAEALRQQTRDRLEVMLQAVWPLASEGSPRHQEAALKIMERQARLEGIDAPSKGRLHLTAGFGAVEDMTDEELKEQCRRVGMKVSD